VILLSSTLKMKTIFHILTALSFFFFCLVFGYRGYEKMGDKSRNIFGQKGEFLYFIITTPWKTKYHWGGIVQLILFFLLIIFQII
jgi:hypothetical protein